MYEIFIENVVNSKNAIQKKRYDLVTIQGNRILSDLAIFNKNFSPVETTYVALFGFILRRIGIDLQTLMTIEKDTAKLKNTVLAILDIKKTNIDMSISKLFKKYNIYLEQYALEINSYEASEYSREGKLNDEIFEWTMERLEKIDTLQLIYGSPIKGINQELRRMSYVEKFSQKNIVVNILLEALEWYSDTVKTGISKFFKDNSNQISANFNEMINSLIFFINSFIKIFQQNHFENDENVSEQELQSILTFLPEVIIKWRNILNSYYDLQSFALPPLKKVNEKELEEGDDDKA
jgi:hypothetical protein